MSSQVRQDLSVISRKQDEYFELDRRQEMDAAACVASVSLFFPEFNYDCAISGKMFLIIVTNRSYP